jgi:integrase
MAYVLLRDIRSEIDKGIFNPERYKKRKPLHLAEYAEQWLKNVVVSRGTLHDYKNSLNNHILPVLGKEFLPDINYDKLRKLQTSINRAPNGKYNTMGCLHKLMQDAHDSGHISQMPKFPGFKGSETIVPPRIDWITDADQWKIIDHIPADDRFIFIFMKLTGCRPSEARAFRWIDIKSDHIIFEKTFGRGNELKEVKQKKTRTFPITEALGALFKQIPRRGLNFVFINPRTGRHYNRHINKIWYKACDDAKLKRVRLYNSTRHSFGTQMLNAGLDKALVQRLLGHADSRMTDRYAEYSTSSLKLALDNIVKLPQNLSVSQKQGNKWETG